MSFSKSFLYEEIAANFNNSNQQVGSLIYRRIFLFKHSLKFPIEIHTHEEFIQTEYIMKFPGENLGEGKPRGIRKNGTLKHTYVYRFMIYEIVST